MTLTGGGTTTFDSGWFPVNTLTVNGEDVDNEGILVIGTQLFAENGSQIINDYLIDADGVAFNSATDGPASQFINANDGQLIDWNDPSQPDDTISMLYSGGGSVSNAYIINSTGATQYGGNNPAAPDMVSGACDQSADCGNGDWSTSETDLSVAGLGGPLALTRQYSSRLAQSESSPGMFGYGWITPFEQRLYLDSTGQSATVRTATGSTATFNTAVLESDGSYQPGTGIYATLTPNSNGSYTYVQPDQTTTLFNAAGYPVSVTNRQNQTTTYIYNGQGQLTQVTAPTGAGAGRSIYLSYITSGPGIGLVDTACAQDAWVNGACSPSAGLVMTYTYDYDDNLVSVSENADPNTGGGTSTPASSQTAWKYYYDDDSGNSAQDLTDLHELTTLFNAESNATTISYEAGYVTGVQQPGKSAEIWNYEPDTTTLGAVGETIQTSPAGNVTTYVFNSQDEPIQTQYADGSTENMTYDSNGDLTGQQDGNGGWTYYQYDSAGNQDQEQNPDGKITTWSYDTAGSVIQQHDLLSETLPSGETTTYNSYDTGGEPASITVSNPNVSGTPSETTSMTYYPDEQLETKQTPVQAQNNTQTTYTYDAYGDLATVTGPATSDFPSGTETTYGYDADGRQVCETTPRVTSSTVQCVNGQGAPTGAETDVYDGLGDLMSSTSPQGNTTTYLYWPDQQVETVTAPQSGSVSNVTNYAYCPNGQTETTTIGTGTSAITQSDTYDADGNLATQTTGTSAGSCTSAPTGRTYTYLYNNMDQLKTETPPSGLASESPAYTYDGDGNVKTITYPAVNGTSEVTTYSYNGEDQASGIGYSNGQTSVADTYEPDGQLATMSDTSGYTSYTYDGLDRLTNVCTDATSFNSGCPNGRQVAYGYNSDNDPMTIAYPNGVGTVDQNFNAADQLTSVEDWDGNTTNFHYDADGNLLTTDLPSSTGETDSNGYNLDDALTSVTMKQGTSTLASITLGRYNDDLISTENQTGLPDTTAGDPCDTYSYSEQQELLGDTPGSSCPANATTNYSYDSARNMTALNTGGTTGSLPSLAYNSDNELCWTSTSSSSSPCSTPPSGATTYTYNPLGERTGQTPVTGTASSYTYNADENLSQATVPSGSSTATVNYVYNGNGQLMTSTTGSTTTQFTWDDTANTPSLLAAGSEDYIYGPDGSPIEQINGSTVQYLHHDQIGSTRLITSTTGSVVDSYTYTPYGALAGYTGSKTGTLLGYAGQYTDPNTGLIYMQARWYDPATGQFMVVDPKVESTWQPYAYANDNPISDTDPSGLNILEPGGAGFMGVPGDDVVNDEGEVVPDDDDNKNNSNKGTLTIEKDRTLSTSEQKVANVLVSEGNDVVAVKESNIVRTPDFFVNGEAADVYTPTTDNVDRIVSSISSKSSQVLGGQ